MLSMMLYSDEETCAMIAGIAYRHNRLESESVPSERGESCLLISEAKLQNLSFGCSSVAHKHHCSAIIVHISEYAPHRDSSNAGSAP